MAAGTLNGHLSLADSRCGQLIGYWRGHQAPLHTLHLCGHRLLSAAQV